MGLLTSGCQRVKHAWDVHLSAGALRTKFMVVFISAALGMLVIAAGVRGTMIFVRHIGKLMSDITASLLKMVFVGIVTLALLGLVELLERTVPLNVEYTRKVAHVGAGIIYYFTPLLFPTRFRNAMLGYCFHVSVFAQQTLRFPHGSRPGSRHSIGELILSGNHLPCLSVG